MQIRTKFRNINEMGPCFLWFYILIHSLNISQLLPQSTVYKEEFRKYFSCFGSATLSEKRLVFCLPNQISFIYLFILICKNNEDDGESALSLLLGH